MIPLYKGSGETVTQYDMNVEDLGLSNLTLGLKTLTVIKQKNL